MRTVNMHVELNQDPASKSPATLFPRSGKKQFSILPPGPIIGMWANKSRVFVVSGGVLYELFQDGTFKKYGTIAAGSNPATMRANGNQLLICSAGNVYISTGVALYQPIISYASGTVNVSGTSVTWVSGDQFFDVNNGGNVQPGDLFMLPPDGNGHGGLFTVGSVTSATQLGLLENAGNLTNYAFQVGTQLLTGVMPEFIDGYFIVNIPNTKTFYISALEDGTSWSALDFQSKNGSIDNIAAIISFSGYLGLVGDTNSAEIWGDSGSADFPFARVSQAALSQGTAAAWSVAKASDGSVLWLSTSNGGEHRVVQMSPGGGAPTRVSNHALENALRSYGPVFDAIGSTYLENGHEYYRIDFPTADKTWDLDLTNGTWCEMGVATTAASPSGDEIYGADWGRFRVHVTWPNGQPMDLVGDRRSGSGRVWQVSPDFTTDDGTDIPLMRVAPHINTNLERMNCPAFALDCEMGTIDPTVMGPDGKPLIPTVSMSYSDDGARTWRDAGAASLGRAGEYEGTFLAATEKFDKTPGSQTNPQVFEPTPLWSGLGSFWISRTFKIKTTARELRAIYAGLAGTSK